MSTETRIATAEQRIHERGYEVRYMDYCDGAETPGILGAIGGATLHAAKCVEVATRHRTREQIADILEHELHHVEDPSWECGCRTVWNDANCKD
jgi:hypothetical protein